MPKDALVHDYPWAAGLIENTFAWLPPSDQMTPLQTLLTERMLLPFEFLTKASHANPYNDQPCTQEICGTVMKKCFEDGGRGSQIDTEIEKLEGLPKISMAYPQQARTANIEDQTKLDLYTLCCSLAHGLHELCDSILSKRSVCY